jgi:hypothetical protein
MPRIPVPPLVGSQIQRVKSNEIDCAFPIDQSQLINSKLYSDRETYIDSLSDCLSYMEIGVGWGYYSDLIIKQKSPKQATLVDLYNETLTCWTWRKFGECKCTPKHEKLYTSETHQQYIIDKFKEYDNVSTIKKDGLTFLKELNAQQKKYDYIYLDIYNERGHIRPVLWEAAKTVDVNGIIGLNEYSIYDGIAEDKPCETYQVVNEFLHFNKNWIVDAIAFHVLGCHDIYIRKIKNEQ